MTQDGQKQAIGYPVSDWREAELPPRTAIEGRFCTVAPLSADDHAADLYEAFGEDSKGRNWTYLGYGPFTEIEAFANWLRGMQSSSDPCFYTIIDKASAHALGLASYLRIDAKMGVIETGHIHFSNPLQQTPTATEAIYLMMRRVFDELGYRRYEWKCDALNHPSRRAARRFGFGFEGVFRQALIYKDRNRDTAWYAVIDKDWPALKQAFETWLAPENFDANGRQRQSLTPLTKAIALAAPLAASDDSL